MDSSGVVNVYLTNIAAANAAPQPIAAFARNHGMGRLEAAVQQGVRQREASFDYRELLRWRRALLHQIDVAGVTSFDVDERVNQVVIGVENTAAAQAVTQFARTLAIPDGAVRTVIEEPTVLRTTLRDSTNRVAGLAIGRGSSATCTLGALAFVYYLGNNVDSSTAYMITNSHCSELWFELDSGWIGQPDITLPIGYEVQDPFPFTHAKIPYCPAYFQNLPAFCRLSDASLYALTIASNPFWHGTIYVTPGPNNINITDVRSIANTTDYPYVGQVVYKTGQGTGSSSGVVQSTCVDRLHSNRQGMSGSYVLLCQATASLYGGPGDSGSPIYATASGYSHLYSPVTLVGILWGGTSTASYFSPWRQVLQDLGGNLAVSR